MTENKYTQQEVLRNIRTLEKRKEELTQQRKELNASILSTKKQIEYWNELDLSQLKIF